MRYFNRIIFFLSVTLVLAQPGENGFTIRGTAFYASGEKLENAKAVLIDTTNRVVQQTWTSKKTLKRFGGGSFTFTNVPPGKYLLKITTGGPVDIKRKLKIDKKSLDLGWLRPIKEFPKYAVPEYSDSLLYKMHPIPTKLHSRDSINVKHVLVFLDGNTRITSIDSITGDTLYYTTTDSSVNDTVDLSVLYLAYNDYGRMMYRSRSLAG